MNYRNTVHRDTKLPIIIITDTLNCLTERYKVLNVQKVKFSDRYKNQECNIKNYVINVT